MDLEDHRVREESSRQTYFGATEAKNGHMELGWGLAKWVNIFTNLRNLHRYHHIYFAINCIHSIYQNTSSNNITWQATSAHRAGSLL